MGFAENYTPPAFEGGAEFVGKEEKAEMIASKEVFPINGVRFKKATQHGDKYFVDITLDGEARTLTFGTESVTTRDFLMESLIKYFKGDDAEPVDAYLRKAGQAILVEIVGAESSDAGS